ncbi:hypothetical protein CLV76_1205 [Marivita geojedonensis]|nr:hypothetical protein CLV76_1205 [Marivita geojedonensis]
MIRKTQGKTHNTHQEHALGSAFVPELKISPGYLPLPAVSRQIIIRLRHPFLYMIRGGQVTQAMRYRRSR